MSYKYFAGDIVLSGSDTLNVEKIDVAYDMATRTGTFTAHGVRGMISLTFDGTLASGATTGSFSFVNNQIDANSLCILYPYTSNHDTGVLGLNVAPAGTADNLHTFYINNSSPATVLNDKVLQLNYVILR